MSPMEKLWFFHKTPKPRTKKVKSFTKDQEQEMKAFTKQLREKGRIYTYRLIEGEGTNVLHIIKYI